MILQPTVQSRLRHPINDTVINDTVINDTVINDTAIKVPYGVPTTNESQESRRKVR